MPNEGSPRYKINTKDIKRVGVTALYTGLAASVTYLLSAVVGLDIVSGTNIDELIVTLALIPGLQLAKRYFSDYTS
mgnify:CR=1 FL=1